jgi:hypothetical protein
VSRINQQFTVSGWWAESINKYQSTEGAPNQSTNINQRRVGRIDQQFTLSGEWAEPIEKHVRQSATQDQIQEIGGVRVAGTARVK